MGVAKVSIFEQFMDHEYSNLSALVLIKCYISQCSIIDCVLHREQLQKVLVKRLHHAFSP